MRAAVCGGLGTRGKRSLIIALRDLVALADESLKRFVATLAAYEAAGRDIHVDGTRKNGAENAGQPNSTIG